MGRRLPPLGSEPITLRRYAPGTDVNGVFVPGSFTDSTIYATWQPLSGPEMQTLSEGDRQRDPHWAASNTIMNTVSQYDGTLPDQLVVDGIVFQIRNTGTFRKIIPHTEVLALRQQETSTGVGP